MRVIVGQAEDIDTLKAVRRVIFQCQTQLAGQIPHAAILMAGVEYDHAIVLQAVQATFPELPLAGCTTAGEMASADGFSDDSLVLMLFCSGQLTFGVGLGTSLARHPDDAVARALEMARGNLPGPEQLCLVFCEGVSAPAHEAVQSLNRKVARGCPVFGGVAAHPWHLETQTRQFCNHEVHEDAIVVLLIQGPVAYRFSVSNSWQPVGKQAPVAACAGSEVRMIGDQPALDFYRHYLGPHAHPVLEFPLAVHSPESRRFYILAPLGYDEQTGGVRFAVPIQEGQIVQLTEVTRERMISDVRQTLAAEVAVTEDDWQPAAGLVFSCATRKHILGTQTTEEIALLQSHLPAGIALAGFYSFGEISPLESAGSSLLHNCTFVTLLLGERLGAGKPAAAAPPNVSSHAAPAKTLSADDLRRRVAFLERKLERSEFYRQRLEFHKDLSASLLRKINREINQARLEIKRKSDLLRHTLALADEIQRNLLPAEAPWSPFFDIAGQSLFCSETGGDYFDYLQVADRSDGNIGVVVGDVSGHGVEAALLMTTVRALLRLSIARGGALDQIVNDVNRHLAEDVGQSGRFMTLCLLRLLPENGEMEWVRAGHEPAVWYDPACDRLVELMGAGTALGVDAGIRFSLNRQAGLAPGQIVFLATDGLWETRNPQGAFFGKQAVHDIIRQNSQAPAAVIVEKLLEGMNRFRGPNPLEDDVTLVVIKIKSLPEMTPAGHWYPSI
ncbi:MAG: SpoIIE family protein phosphatase [Desulfobacterales bacterium]|nr:SpoIIE family protein phosphatase [Desulfobacterales bacterium]